IVDLLPAGFEVVVEHPAAPQPGEGEGDDVVSPTEAEGEGEAEGEAGEPSPAPSGGMASFIRKGGDLQLDSADVREDRVLLFAAIPPQSREFVYQMRATNQGKVQVPPLFAASMYDPAVKALS